MKCPFNESCYYLRAESECGRGENECLKPYREGKKNMSEINIEKIREHYEHAKRKHPCFCDWVIPQTYTPKQIRERIDATLKKCREDIALAQGVGILSWDDILNCEVWEVFDAIAKGDTAHAVEECYDAIAVLLRTVDVLEGRQKLGNMETNDEA